MATAKKTTAKTKAKTEAKTAPEAPKYGVNELIEATGLKGASVRVALRELGVEKNFGNRYGWDTKKDFDGVVKAMKERSAKRIGAKSEGARDDAPKKTTKKTTKAKAA